MFGRNNNDIKELNNLGSDKYIKITYRCRKCGMLKEAFTKSDDRSTINATCSMIITSNNANLMHDCKNNKDFILNNEYKEDQEFGIAEPIYVGVYNNKPELNTKWHEVNSEE